LVQLLASVKQIIHSHVTKESTKHTLVVFNPETKSPPMCLEKKLLGHPQQKLRSLYGPFLLVRSLEDSTVQEPVRHGMDNLNRQKTHSFFKDQVIFAWSK
jgi:hypothetical protein